MSLSLTTSSGVPLFGAAGHLAECIKRQSQAKEQAEALSEALTSGVRVFGSPNENSRELIRSGSVPGFGSVPSNRELILDAAQKLVGSILSFSKV